MYKHILIATDGSELAGKALDHGLSLTKAAGATATVVIVTEPVQAFEIAQTVRTGGGNPFEQYEAAWGAHAKRILDKAADAAGKVGVPCDGVHVKDQHPAEGIVKTAEEKRCDLIVMASHGRRGVGQILLGSQTTKVLATTRIPVLVVR